MTADFQGLGYRRANRWFRGRYPAVSRELSNGFAMARQGFRVRRTVVLGD